MPTKPAKARKSPKRKLHLVKQVEEVVVSRVQEVHAFADTLSSGKWPAIFLNGQIYSPRKAPSKRRSAGDEAELVLGDLLDVMREFLALSGYKEIGTYR